MVTRTRTSPLVLSNLLFYKMWKVVLINFKLKLRCCCCSAMAHAQVSHGQQLAAVESPPQAFWIIQQHRHKHTSDTAAPLSTLTFTSRWPLTIKKRLKQWPQNHGEPVQQRQLSHTLSLGAALRCFSWLLMKVKLKTPLAASPAVLSPPRLPFCTPCWQSEGVPGSRLGVEGDGVAAPQMYSVSPSGQEGSPLFR